VELTFPTAERYSLGFCFSLGVGGWRAGQPKEVALTGPNGDERFRVLRRVIARNFLPHRVLVAGGGSADLPLMQNRPANQVKAYVCEAYMCAEPTDSPERLTELLSLQP